MEKWNSVDVQYICESVRCALDEGTGILWKIGPPLANSWYISNFVI